MDVNGTPSILNVEHLLVATGRAANVNGKSNVPFSLLILSGLGLDVAGVKYSPQGIKVCDLLFLLIVHPSGLRHS